MGNAVLDRLLKQREDQENFIRETLDRAEAEGRDLVDAETRNMTAATERIAEIDAQIKPLEAFEERAAAHRSSGNRFTPANVVEGDDDNDQAGGEARSARRGAGARVKTKAREIQYETAGHFIADQLRAAGNPHATGREYAAPDVDAQQRLAAYVEQRANQTTTDLPGLLPENIVGSIHTDIDGSRPFVTSIGAKAGGMSPGAKFLRPVVTQHTTVGKQTAEKTELASQALKITNLEFDKETFGGYLNVSRQSIDWTSPSAWNAVISDLQQQYGIFTEDWAAEAFDALVTQEVELTADDVDGWVSAIYAAAAKAIQPTGAERASALRLPNHIWTSTDMWGKLGAMLAKWRAGGDGMGAGTTNAGTFKGTLLDFERTMVPGLPTGTVIVGRTNLVEFYEERVGLLQAVEPKILGVEVAYGGYAAFGALDATGFVKIVNDVP